ncbi:G protein subunit beta NDAI_0E01500 [Naumovozyma dairenensis CBS 421]|uniref:Uncharacterized protein n=1 Tax=Naumovozyma dairenensis (strain ATCC 10597 / BCRC 20456 / CBS 421 / NBRC 0211 / NRRL Y-12639) TaxID=1071378 RepID=G0WB46_NAUDC|nr:hypothetical protein NDAI_0E01500 [Naumovozyma dairenensis CBS 421]CCD24966.1 hypothetical protein NDAI_0E01500 [Naumovozyma dairenensis CBS 421]
MSAYPVDQPVYLIQQPQQQYLSYQDIQTLEDEIQQKIDQARNETKHLYTQVNKIKSKIQDADLFQISQQIEPLIKPHINLKPTLTLRGHNNKISQFKWSLNSKSILSSSQDGFMLIWDSATGLKQNAIPLDSQWVLSCAISPSGKLVASGGLNNNCTIYRVSKENRVQQNVVSIFKGHTCYISDIEFWDNSHVITSSGDMTCALWNIPKAKRLREYSDHLGDVLALAMPSRQGATETDGESNDSSIFASCGSDGYTYIWDTRSPSAVQKFFVSDSDVTSIKFFKDGNSIITGSDDGIINMFDLRSDCSIASYSLQQGMQKELKHPTYTSATMEYSKYSPQSPFANSITSSYLDNQGVVSLDFSGSGRLMYACYTDIGCVIWDLLKGEIVGKLDGHSDRISGVETSPDGLAVCTASWDSTMKIWSPRYM